MSKEQGNPPKSKGNSSGPQGLVSVGCAVQGCKSKEKKFGFCTEHYGQFKFGLLKKNGNPVPDYEKKFEHYSAYLEKRKSQKVA